MSSDFAIKVENLSKCYQIYDKPRDRLLQGIMPRLQRLAGRQPKQYSREFWALRDVSFEVMKGETVGIIGRNGSGKSTLLQMICGTLTPTSGSIKTNGRVAALLELGAGFNPEFTGRENVYMNASILGLAKADIDARFEEISGFADIGDFIDQPVKAYSSGMFVRLAFSVSISVEPDILIIDEALAVGDALFQKKCYTALNKLKQNGTTILFVSHDIWTVKSFTDKALLLNTGKMIDFGSSAEVCLRYNQLLFGNDVRSEQTADGPHQEVVSVTPINASHNYGSGCAELYRIELLGLLPGNTIRGGEELTIKCYCRWDIERISTVIQKKLLFSNINVGLLFQNVKHINIFGFNSHQSNIVINPQLQAEVAISFNFTVPNLASDDYFITIAIVVGDQENHEILVWYDDAVHIKCNATNKYIFGVFAVEANISVN